MHRKIREVILRMKPPGQEDLHERIQRLLDGEMEILAAGAWRNHPAGTNVITLTGNAAVNLTTNRALLIIETNSIRLEWRTAKRASTGIIREIHRP